MVNTSAHNALIYHAESQGSHSPSCQDASSLQMTFDMQDAKGSSVSCPVIAHNRDLSPR